MILQAFEKTLPFQFQVRCLCSIFSLHFSKYASGGPVCPSVHDGKQYIHFVPLKQFEYHIYYSLYMVFRIAEVAECALICL
jgi:hypothetical protein